MRKENVMEELSGFDELFHFGIWWTGAASMVVLVNFVSYHDTIETKALVRHSASSLLTCFFCSALVLPVMTNPTTAKVGADVVAGAFLAWWWCTKVCAREVEYFKRIKRQS